jgi:AcrR family transcriptional regulator
MASRPSDAQGASSRDRLLQSAKRLFAAQGYEQTATSAIAREAGTSESQLMRYFGGKVGLLEALFDAAWVDLNARVKKVTTAELAPRDVLLEVLLTIAAAFGRDPELAMLMLFEGRRIRGDEPRVRLSPGFVAFTEVIRGIVRRGQAARELDPSLDAAAATSAILGAAEAMIRDRVVARVAGGRTYSEKEVRRILEAILGGFETGNGRSRSRPARTPAPRTATRAK